MSPPKHLRSGSLDGLRAIAVLAVMGVHIGFPGDRDIGALGVDLFFVLSGFLITTLLIKEFHATGRIHLRQFWARRFLRLMPAYWLYLTIIMVIFACTYDRSQTTARGWSPELYIASLWGYFANYTPPVKIWIHQNLTFHLWSLSTEEQFYFMWPFLMLLSLRFKRGWVMPLVLATGIMVYRQLVTAAALEAALYTRGIGIVIGSAVAYGLSLRPKPIMTAMGNSALRSLWVLVTVALLVALTWTMHSYRADPSPLAEITPPSIIGNWLPPTDLLFAGLVAGLWYFPGGIISRLLSWQPLAYTGAISYGLYLYHMLASRIIWDILLPKSANDVPPALQVHDPLQSLPPAAAYLLRVTSFLALTFTMAALSFHFLEKPFLTLKDRFRPQPVKV